MAALTGLIILVVEDELLLADHIVEILQEAGAEIIGPVGTLSGALALLQTIGPLDGAVLDIRLQDEAVYPLADALRERAVPFVFVTGYMAGAIPARYRNIPRYEKPLDPMHIAEALALYLQEQRQRKAGA